MSPRRARPGAALALALALASPSARAQAPDPAGLFAEAVALLRAERHQEALAVLERVRALRETPTVHYNMAIALRALGRPVAAIASLDAYLALAGDRIDDARRAEVRARVAELRALVATVTTTVRAGDAAVRVTLDGAELPRDRWDRPLPMDPGRHVWRLTGEGLEPLEVARDVAPGAELACDLRPAPVDVVTRLAVVASAPRAEVVLDGMLVGSDGYDARVDPGRHAVEVRARGFLPYRAALDIAPGAAVRVRATLTPDVPITARWWFWVGLSALVAGAITGAVVAASSGTQSPDCGTTGHCF